MLRLLIALLALCLSLPAAATPGCHEMTARTTMTAMHHDHRPTPPAPNDHMCIGCVPLPDWLQPVLTAPPLPAADSAVSRIAALDRAQAPAPALPPPRLG